MSEGWFTHNNVRIHISGGGSSALSLTGEQIERLGEAIRAKVLQAPRRPGRYRYPDQSIASMTPEQAGEIVESFRMEAEGGGSES